MVTHADQLMRAGGLEDERVIALLRGHLEDMAEHSSAEAMHALDTCGLAHPAVSFWSAWLQDELAGCIALKQLDVNHGEIKSMCTAQALRGRGIGRTMLQFVLAEAAARGYRRLSLETGSRAFFKPARQLYRSLGFDYCQPFADYPDDPSSAFMTRPLF